MKYFPHLFFFLACLRSGSAHATHGRGEGWPVGGGVLDSGDNKEDGRRWRCAKRRHQREPAAMLHGRVGRGEGVMGHSRRQWGLVSGTVGKRQHLRAIIGDIQAIVMATDGCRGDAGQREIERKGGRRLWHWDRMQGQGRQCSRVVASSPMSVGVVVSVRRPRRLSGPGCIGKNERTREGVGVTLALVVGVVGGWFCALLRMGVRVLAVWLRCCWKCKKEGGGGVRREYGFSFGLSLFYRARLVRILFIL